MRVLVLGSGGREHALAWRIARDPAVTAVLSAPGNPGCALIGPCVPVDITRPDQVLALAERERIDLTVVGPEAALDQGVADRFRASGRRIVGPDRHVAALESSKAFAKRFMSRHGIPTARYRVCETADEALAAVTRGDLGLPLVVKADGLAAGKGVVMAADRAEAEAAVRAAMVDRLFGAAGARVVLEECLSGPEVSYFVLADGVRAVRLLTAQDHKRIFDDDRGPNTGGMGAFAPSPLVDATLDARVMREIVTPVIDGFAAEGHPYQGFLYVSLMLTADGPRVIEFNVRLGDPEAQVVLPLMDGPFADLLAASAEGRLTADAAVVEGCAVGVVLASAGYPAGADPGRDVRGLERLAGRDGVHAFHAGTRQVDGRIVTAGGRVLTIVGLGARFETAMSRAYDAVADVSFEGMQYRHDIGRKAIGVRS